MITISHLTITTITTIISSVLAQDDAHYCKFSPKHTMCQYQGSGQACNGKPISRGVTPAEIATILDVHNNYRAKIARGEERRGSPGPQPPAANMKIMVWDEELSRIAQRHADQCTFAHDCSSCRKTDRFGVGQNLYIYKQTQRKPDNDWEKAVTDWYDEVEIFSNKHVEPFKFSTPTGHYTQVVWADTDKVGCGATSYRDGKWFATLYTCNYGPNGNFIRGQMYADGAACSQCSSGSSCSSQYPGLCDFARANSSSPLSPPERKPVTATRAPAAAPVFTRKTTRPTTSTTTTATTARPSTKKQRRITTKKSKFGSNLQPKITTVVSRRKEQPGRANILFSCDFNTNERSCNIKNRGKTWSSKEAAGNRWREVELTSSRDTAEFYFKQLIDPPQSSLACLDFRFKKFSSDGSKSSLTVLAWPNRGKPGKVTIEQDSPDSQTWVRAQVTFKNVDRQFLLMMRARGVRAGSLVLAVDSVLVTSGRCQES